MPFKIVGVTVSLEVADSNYGNGGKRFVSLRAETPREDAATLNEALLASLDMHLVAFESATAAAMAGGALPPASYNEARASFHKRMRVISTHLTQNPPTEDPQ